MSEWVKNTPNPSSIYKQTSQAPRHGPVATTTSLGSGRARPTVGLGRPRSDDPTSGLFTSSFLQRLSNGYLVFCPSASVQIHPQSGSNIFSRFSQAQKLFSEILFKKEKWLEKF
jgi:hypothetical protein